MGRPQYIPSFFFYKFAQSLADPYTSFEAYRSGNIDQRGNIIGNEGSIDPFEYFIIKLKKILDELPPGPTKYKTGNLFGVMELFSEEASQFGLTQDDFNILLEAELMARELNEDMSTGGVAGDIGTPTNAPGANKGNVSGYDPVMGSMMTRSAPVNMFGAVEMFNVPSSEFKLFRVDKGYPKTATGNYIRRYGHRNANQKLAIRDEDTGEVYWLPSTNKKSFVEQFSLKGLEILKEEKDILLDRDELSDIVKNTGKPPVEPSPDSAKNILALQNRALRSAKRPSEKFERKASIEATLTSGSELLDLISSSDSRDRQTASDTLTLMKHFANTSTSDTRPYDGIMLGRGRDGRVSPILYDAKGTRWSAITPVSSGDFESEFEEEDPFRLWSSAIEHSGNVDFEEDLEKIQRGNIAAAKIRGSPKFQEKAKDIAASRIEGKYPIISGAAPGKILTPKQVSDVLRGGIEDLTGRPFRINRLGRSTTGVRAGSWQNALQDYRRNLEKYEESGEGNRGRRPIAPQPVKLRPSISTVSNALTKRDLSNISDVSGNAYNLSQDDIRANEELYGSEVSNKFIEMIKKFQS